jgi:hypothetical protein
MTGQTALRHAFVEFIPDQLEEGVVYISIEHTTAAHKCACGCGSEVFTPLSSTDWKLIFNGETVSLSPSIGNWSFDCQSHYWIEQNRIRWAPRWSRAEIDRGRRLDRLAKERGPIGVAESNASLGDDGQTRGGVGLWMRRILRRSR